MTKDIPFSWVYIYECGLNQEKILEDNNSEPWTSKIKYSWNSWIEYTQVFEIIASYW